MCHELYNFQRSKHFLRKYIPSYTPFKETILKLKIQYSTKLLATGCLSSLEPCGIVLMDGCYRSSVRSDQVL